VRRRPARASHASRALAVVVVIVRVWSAHVGLAAVRAVSGSWVLVVVAWRRAASVRAHAAVVHRAALHRRVASLVRRVAHVLVALRPSPRAGSSVAHWVVALVLWIFVRVVAHFNLSL
jgi:hypothetical protein